MVSPPSTVYKENYHWRSLRLLLPVVSPVTLRPHVLGQSQCEEVGHLPALPQIYRGTARHMRR